MNPGSHSWNARIPQNTVLIPLQPLTWQQLLTCPPVSIIKSYPQCRWNKQTLTCRLYLPATSSSLALSAASLGTLMCTDARTVVPRLVGQKVRKPRRSSCEKGMRFSMSFTAVTRRRYTCNTVNQNDQFNYSEQSTVEVKTALTSHKLLEWNIIWGASRK